MTNEQKDLVEEIVRGCKTVNDINTCYDKVVERMPEFTNPSASEHTYIRGRIRNQSLSINK